ncbi:PREDICTED: outer dense fiber protein 3-like protein 1 [Crocodylus porosus]|uniref:outer dense fiber protein 3-like protein 1 n=1 Tax=Crocodylus porosus TaxID=8502 RepID=UPI00093D1B40|nr:PREDICTED: outer dense fiber protein 3-like protein 1 [Crocodylus porosus]
MEISRAKSKTITFGNGGCRPSATEASGVKRFPPISSKIKGPGPAKYARKPCTGFMNHDFTMFAEPAYTMHIKHTGKTLTDVVSPGPCYFVDPHVSRFGKQKIPLSVIFDRERDPKPSGVPAPNAYYRENVHPPGEPHAPAYSLGVYTCYYKHDPNPAPNRYNHVKVLGPKLPVKSSAPCYSMASRLDSGGYAEDLATGPGPAFVSRPEPNVYLNRQPAFSMREKYEPYRERLPGPADYKAEHVTITKLRAPDFSFGIRHSNYLTPLIVDVKE